MPRKTIDIQFPAAGVVRRMGLRATTESRGPFPAPWSTNVRLEDSLTNRLRGGSFTAQASSALDSRYHLLMEDGDHYLLEDGDYIASETDNAIYVYLTTETGKYVTTENGGYVVLGPRNSTATGFGSRVNIAGGDNAPDAGPADCLHRDRLFRVEDTAVFCSRQGHYTDWNYGAELDDTGRAAVFQAAEGGEIGEEPIALVPHKDGHLLVFTTNETWVLSGDPTTGSLRNVSREVGIISPRAWCKNHDTCYFLSSLGLYSVGTDGSGLKPVSEDRIPEDLTGVDDEYCVMDYYHQDRCVYIHLSGDVVSWAYDTARDGFWPFDLGSTDSHVLLGPFRLGQPRSFGRVLNLQGNIAADSDDVTWRIVTGDTAEGAAANGKAAIVAALAGTSYASYVSSSGTWSAGRAHIVYPRNRAIWCCVWLSCDGDWAYEASSMTAIVSGDWR